MSAASGSEPTGGFGATRSKGRDSGRRRRGSRWRPRRPKTRDSDRRPHCCAASILSSSPIRAAPGKAASIEPKRYPRQARPVREPGCRQRRADHDMHQQAAAAGRDRPISQPKRGRKIDEGPERTGQRQQDDHRPVDRQSPAPSLRNAKFAHREMSIPSNSRKFEGIRGSSMVQSCCKYSNAQSTTPDSCAGSHHSGNGWNCVEQNMLRYLFEGYADTIMLATTLRLPPRKPAPIIREEASDPRASSDGTSEPTKQRWPARRLAYWLTSW